jgi:uncharacterized membrane protein HdeD (DUF308 family)
MTVSIRPDLAPVQTMRSHRALFTVLGAILIVLGASAFVAAFAFTLAAVLALGVILVVAGVVQIVQGFRGRMHGISGWNALAGLLYVIAGAMLIYKPLLGALTVTFILASFLLVSGVVRIVHAFSMRQFNNWGILAFGGGLDLILGLLILAHWPVSALWVLGLFLGIDMIFQGVAWITLANSHKRIGTQQSTPIQPPSTPAPPVAS